MRKNQWSAEEDKILDQLCKENLRNIAKASRLASEKLNRSSGACSTRWYTCLSNPESKHYTGTCFVTISNRERYTNRVLESASDTYKDTSNDTLFSKIKKFFKIK